MIPSAMTARSAHQHCNFTLVWRRMCISGASDTIQQLHRQVWSLPGCALLRLITKNVCLQSFLPAGSVYAGLASFVVVELEIRAMQIKSYHQTLLARRSLGS